MVLTQNIYRKVLINKLPKKKPKRKLTKSKLTLIRDKLTRVTLKVVLIPFSRSFNRHKLCKSPNDQKNCFKLIFNYVFI